MHLVQRDRHLSAQRQPASFAAGLQCNQRFHVKSRRERTSGVQSARSRAVSSFDTTACQCSPGVQVRRFYMAALRGA